MVNIKENSKAKQDELLEMTVKLLQKSSVPVISMLGHSKSFIRKLFWIIVLVFCTFGCTYKLHGFLSIYLQYPVLVDLEVQRNLRADFPAVTVCNLNRVNSKYTDCVKNSRALFKCSAYASPRSLFVSETKKIFTSSQGASAEKKLYAESSALLSGFSELSNVSRRGYGYRYHELISNCVFQSKACSNDDFSIFLNLQFGNCYTFNSLKYSDGDNPYMSYVGEDSGLQLELSLLAATYLNITESVGARIIIHSPYEDPNPSVDGINISPGFESFISISKSSVKRLPEPYRDRCFNYDVKNSDPFLKSEHDCTTACIQKSNNIKCSCVDPLLPSFGNKKACSLRNVSELACLSKVTKEVSESGLPCKCSIPCLSTEYKVEVSFSNLSAYTMYRNEKDIAVVKIYYGNVDHVVYSQRPAYTQAEMFAHIGGILGIWLGLSAIAIFENMENIFMMIKHLSNRK